MQALAPGRRRRGRPDRRPGSPRWHRDADLAAAPWRWRDRAGCGRGRSGSRAKARGAAAVRRRARLRRRRARSWRGWSSAATGRSRTKSRMRRFTFTASRPVAGRGRRPRRSRGGRPGIASASFLAYVYGTILSRVPWSTSVGAVIRGSRSCTLSRRSGSQRPRRGPRAWSPGPGDAVLDALQRVGLGVQAGEAAAGSQPPKSSRTTGATFSSKGCGIGLAYCRR